MSKISKTPFSPESPSPKAPPAAHLDDKISQFITATSRGAWKYRVPVVAATGALVVTVSAYILFSWMRESTATELSERLYQLRSHDEKELPLPLLASQAESLAKDAQGTLAEKFILKEIAQEILDRTFLKSEPLDPIGGAAAEKPSIPAPPDPSAVKTLEALAAAGLTRFPDDPDMKKWSTELSRRVQGEREFRENEKARGRRSFAPVVAPPKTAEAPPGSAPAPAAPPASPPPAPNPGGYSPGSGAAPGASPVASPAAAPPESGAPRAAGR